MQYRRFWIVALMLVLVLAQGHSVLAAGSKEPAPLLNTDSASAIPGEYIVVFKPGVAKAKAAAAIAGVQQAGGSVHFRYRHALQGFAASLPEQALNGIRRNPNVLYVEADQTISVNATQSPATWGLDRIDQTNLPLNNSYSYDFTGAGVTAYIIDTGIRLTHDEFGGRATIGVDTVGDGQNGNDCQGHGTHVAGTVGGTNIGVAKQVSLVAVRVLDCKGTGSTAGGIAGIDWVTADHTNGKAVANMSLTGNPSTSLDSAVANSIADGVVYAVAAGNNKRDACKLSPARLPDAITVGASTAVDARASFSNFGKCLDIFAPGTDIFSASNTGDAVYTIKSGTSMATPHVAGVVALFLEGHAGSPQQVRDAIIGAGTPGLISDPGKNSPNLLLYSLVP